MTVRHKRGGGDQHTVYLNDEQKAAVLKFQKDFQKVLPRIQESQMVARRIFQEMVDAPTWQIAETERPEHMPEPDEQVWTVGHAQVNEVDHIDIGEDSE
jgi:hypothetical protein